jgi:hypothetical protein
MMTQNEWPYTKSDAIVAFLAAAPLLALMLPVLRGHTGFLLWFDIVAPIIVGVPALLYLLAKPAALRRRAAERLILDTIPSNRAFTANEIIKLVTDHPRGTNSLAQRAYNVADALQAIYTRSPDALQRKRRLFPKKKYEDERFLVLDIGTPPPQNQPVITPTKSIIGTLAFVGALISSFIVSIFIHPHPFIALLVVDIVTTLVFWGVWQFALAKIFAPEEASGDPEALTWDIQRCLGDKRMTYSQICEAIPPIDTNPIDHGLRVALEIRNLEDEGTIERIEGAIPEYKLARRYPITF